MRIVILADPHSNVVALRAITQMAESIQPSRYLLAGDLVGYGPWPNEVIEIVEKHKMFAIRGNHDESVITGDYTWMNEHASVAARWNADRLTERSRNYLELLNREMKVELGGRLIGLFHGSPDDPDEYVMETARARQILDGTDCDVVICGHTHVPMQLCNGGKLFINPGSVGQPRDGNPEAAFIELDLIDMKPKLHRVRYDIISVQRQMRSAGLPPFLADRLSSGH